MERTIPNSVFVCSCHGDTGFSFTNLIFTPTSHYDVEKERRGRADKNEKILPYTGGEKRGLKKGGELFTFFYPNI